MSTEDKEIGSTPVPQEQQPEEQKPNLVDVEQLQKEFQEKSRKYLVEQTQHVIIPSFAKWFNLNQIHALEKKSFPDFFSEDSIYKTPQSYKYIRDFIINTFRLNPKEYLTITAIRRNLAGDVTNIIRIHQFLEKWGLINYQIDPKTKSTILGPQYTGHFQITLDAPEGLIPYVSEDAKIVKGAEEVSTSETPVKQELPSGTPLSLNMEIRRDVYSTGETKFDFKPQHKVSYSCSICGKDATEVRYHNLKLKSYSYNPNSTINNASILCSICYDQGLFPSNFTSSDFVEFRQLAESQTWTEQEILLLLEGIEMFGTFESTNALITAGSNINVNAQNQWNKIAEHVSTKTKEQCLTKFLQLPIEDKFLHKLIADNTPSTQHSNKANLVEEIAQKLIQSNQGQELIKSNSEEYATQSASEQLDLINQIIDMTVEKVDLKLGKIDQLQNQLVSITNQLQLERKQLQLTRWVQLNKINKLKQEKPELGDVLADLMKPVKISDVNSGVDVFGEEKVEEGNEEDAVMDVDKEETTPNTDDSIPISISKPKEYQFWSG
ncbi:RSC8 [Candida metapsilosis]|uniref:RSC8 n=1 Tax=Candida metapsilosis TaxID=273372 RepID=A0A8H8D9J5_9ASCO|nr:RSC8 [Candida metapsilosis]